METVLVNSWDRRPSFNDLRHYPKNEKEEVDIIEIVRNEPAVDFCVGKNRKDDFVYVFGKNNAEARIERRYKKEGSCQSSTGCSPNSCIPSIEWKPPHHLNQPPAFAWTDSGESLSIVIPTRIAVRTWVW